MSNHIHFIGICGTGMGSLAGLCKEGGYHVTGSDEHIYPPMSTQLGAMGIPINQGYKEAHVIPRPDLAVIGNVISKENPEAQTVLKEKIPYHSMPDALATLFLDGRLPIVISGTHGKTTTASIAAWLLDHAGRAPGFFIGGIPLNFGASCRIGGGKEFVIEGDEYDTAFFEKTPKFLHYRAQAAILGPIEFDHADIYRDLDHVVAAFRQFVAGLPSTGLLIACADNSNVQAIIPHASCRVVTYGVTAAAADYRAEGMRCGPAGAVCSIVHNGTWAEYHSPLPGRHNLQNAIGVIALCTELGIPTGAIQEGLRTFAGVKRRQEIRGVARGVTVIDDFAHHPTAIRETLRALAARYPGQRLLVAFEPRSNTTRRNIFQAELAESFRDAARVALAPLYRPDKVPVSERLDLDRLVSALATEGIVARTFPAVDPLVEWIAREANDGDVIVGMSNGGFDDFHDKVLHKLAHRS